MKFEKLNALYTVFLPYLSEQNSKNYRKAKS